MSIAALEIIVIPSSVVEAVSEQMRQDWQKRGLGGLVSAVDLASGTVTISTSSFGGKKTIVVRTSKSTVVRRYAPDSVKPEDARLSTLQEVRVGDQLRARGDRSADGGELAAEEIYAGNFPNVAGLIKSVDASAGTLSVQDVVSKKTVQLKITADSQLHKIPAEMAQRFAMRLKAALPPGMPGAAMNSSSGSSSSAGATEQAATGRPAPGGAPSGGASSGSGGMGGGPGGGRPGGSFDFQRLLDQTPASRPRRSAQGRCCRRARHRRYALRWKHGDQVVQRSGTDSSGCSQGSQAMMLAPWSLGGAPGGDAAHSGASKRTVREDSYQGMPFRHTATAGSSVAPLGGCKRGLVPSSREMRK